MFAIAFDMVVSDLKKNYGEPYNNAYFEIGIILRKYDFYNTQGSVYLTERNDMANLYSRSRTGATLPRYLRNSDGIILTIRPLAAMREGVLSITENSY